MKSALLSVAVVLGAAIPLAGRGQESAAWPASVSGTAEVRLSEGRDRASTHLTFAAGVDPPALRVEIVEAGQLAAVLWYDPTVIRILVPGEPNLLHEGPPTRATLSAALGLPFCPQQLLYALRAGLAPAPDCETHGEKDVPVLRDGRLVGLRRAGASPKEPLALEFLRFMKVGERVWPRRAVLRAPDGEASVTVLAIQDRKVSPLPPVGPAWDSAQRVEAAVIARALGLSGED